MFGPTYKVRHGELSITMRAIRKEEAKLVAAGISNPKVNRYLNYRHGETPEQAEEWLKKLAEDQNGVGWGIALTKSDRLIGCTTLRYNLLNHNASSGVMIFDPKMWGQGVVSLTHLVRTAYAADSLDVATITTTVFKPNIASRRALERVGYVVTGYEYGTRVGEGQLQDILHLQWVNPAWKERVFLGEVPELFVEPLEKANKALQKARKLLTIR
jgi:RimJ/RimL family protein N-acetyltransferase